MSYVDDNLAAGEQVLHRANLHWGIFVGPGILLFIGVIIAIAAGAGVGGGGGAFLALVILLLFAIPIIRALVVYLTTEFAVTSRRVIAKKGFIKRHTLELNHNRVEGLALDQGVIARDLQRRHHHRQRNRRNRAENSVHHPGRWSSGATPWKSSTQTRSARPLENRFTAPVGALAVVAAVGAPTILEPHPSQTAPCRHRPGSPELCFSRTGQIHAAAPVRRLGSRTAGIRSRSCTPLLATLDLRRRMERSGQWNSPRRERFERPHQP